VSAKYIPNGCFVDTGEEISLTVNVAMICSVGFLMENSAALVASI
jgi:hypothetical protein